MPTVHLYASRLVCLLIMLVYSGCATRALFDVGHVELHHSGYSQVRADPSHLYLEFRAHGKLGHAWTSFPLAKLDQLEKISAYDGAACHAEDFGYHLFSPVERGELPDDIAERTDALPFAIRNRSWKKDWDRDLPTLVKELKTAGSDGIISDQYYPFFLLALSDPVLENHRAIYMLSGPSACSRAVERRYWWSYPVMIVGAPFAVAADLVLVPLAGLGAVAHGAGMVLLAVLRPEGAPYPPPGPAT